MLYKALSYFAGFLCFLAFATFIIWPSDSIRFLLSDEPLNGWGGSLFGGLVIAWLLLLIGVVIRSFEWISKRSPTYAWFLMASGWLATASAALYFAIDAGLIQL